MNTPPPRRILIVRLSAIGDIVMASGLISALRSIWPDSHIAWLAEIGPADLLKTNPLLDEVIELPRRHWKKMSREGQRIEANREMLAFSKTLKMKSFDLVLDLQGLLKSGIWAWATRAPRRIGLGSREGSQWLMTETYPRNQIDPRMGKEYRALAVHLGASDESFVPHIAISESVQATARRLLGKDQDTSRKIALLAPFTTRPQKHWFTDQWLGLAQRLDEAGFDCVILGGPDDAPQAEEMIQASSSTIRSLTGKTSLLESAALIETGDLLIGVDTGLTHMGMASTTPTVALFGSTLPYWETRSARAEILYTQEPCSPCHRRPSCNGHFTCMRHHSADTVFRAVLRVMASTGEHPDRKDVE